TCASRLTGSTGRWMRSGRGLSPPVRTFTDPGTREQLMLVRRRVYDSRPAVTRARAGERHRALVRAPPGGGGGPLGLRGQRPDRGRRVLGAVDGRPRHEHVGAGVRAHLDGLGGDAAVDLDPEVEVAALHQLAVAADLGDDDVE